MSPRPATAASSAELAPPLDSLERRILGLRIQWDNFELLLERLLEEADHQWTLSEVRRWKTTPEKGRHTRTDADHRQEQFEAFIDEVDAVILGLAA